MTQAKLATPVTDDEGNKITDGIGSITWTATGGGVPVGTFDTFSIEAGPLPEQPTIAFRAEQTYQGGQVVDWADPTVPGGAEPDHPAPVLHLTSATGTDTPAAAGSVSSTPLAAPVSTASDSTGRTLGIIASWSGPSASRRGARRWPHPAAAPPRTADLCRRHLVPWPDRWAVV